MRKPIAGFWWSPAAEGVPALVVTAAFFSLGGIAGCLLAFHASEGGAEALCAYLKQFLALARDGGLAAPAMPQLLWRTLRWPLAALLLGFTAFGVLGVPALAGLRGFFLAFSVASFARAYGRSGLTTAFLLLGIPAILAIPVFFFLSVQSFSAACVLARQGKRDPSSRGEYLFRCGLCAVAIFVGLLLERYLVPTLVSDWAGILVP